MTGVSSTLRMAFHHNKYRVAQKKTAQV